MANPYFWRGKYEDNCVFFIKYLRMLGFSANNDIFADNAWYFRNALVRANYTNLQKGIHETTEYLELFLRNLLLNEKNELNNRDMHISGLLKMKKVDIGEQKVDIESMYSGKVESFSGKTIAHIQKLFETFGFNGIFGRGAVCEILGLKNSSASKLIAKLVGAGIIETVSGYGKGKYRFLK